MNRTTKNIDDALLAKFISGEATADEKKTVSVWMNESEENRSYFESFAGIWMNSTTDGLKRPDTCNAWNNVEQRIHTPRYKMVISFVAAAAAVLVIAFLVFSPEKYNKTTLTAINQPVRKILPDGTEVILNDSSALDYFLDKKKNLRTASLSGSAFFHVKRDTTQAFIVRTRYGNVKVLGTQFDVNVINGNGVYVNVLSGLVEISKENAGILLLRKGESGYIPADESSVEKTIQNPSEFFNINGTLSFNNMPLNEVFSCLERCYSVRISVGKGINTGQLFTSVFKGDSVDEILNVITRTFGLKFKKSNGKYFILNSEE